MDYQRLNAMLTGRCAQRRKLERNTYAERRDDGSIAVRLHQTDILTFYKNGTVRFSTGGWATMTTKARMNDYAPNGWHVGSDRGMWRLYYNSPRGPRVAFFDGIRINTKRGAVNVDDARAAKRLERQQDEQRREHAREKAKARREYAAQQRIAVAFGEWLFAFSLPERTAWRVFYDYAMYTTVPDRVVGAAIERFAEAVREGIDEWLRAQQIAREVEGVEPGPDAIEAWHFVSRRLGGDGERGRLSVTSPPALAHTSPPLPVRAGQTVYVPAGAELCQYGLHASLRASEAYHYHRGQYVCRVLVWGNVQYDNAKLVGQYRRVEWMARITESEKMNQGPEAVEAYCMSLQPTSVTP